MAHTIVSSATRTVVIGDDRPFVIIGEPTAEPSTEPAATAPEELR